MSTGHTSVNAVVMAVLKSEQKERFIFTDNPQIHNGIITTIEIDL